MNLESRGIPSGFVASREFVAAAAAQGKSLGISPASVFVAHPIQDRTDEEMAQLALNSIDAIKAMICKEQL
tara:strand:+ start:50 stop:262 length:213 start_codon:yes stop_codon:yes gene_type:complete